MDISMLPDNPKKLKVQGNEQLLHLAMANIINNGCKYSNFQQVKVSLVQQTIMFTSLSKTAESGFRILKWIKSTIRFSVLRIRKTMKVTE
jgi:signal transduction histidine kinase